MAEKRMVACDVCGTYHEFQKGLMGWGKVSCSCGHKYGHNENGQRLLCKCCGMPVYYSAAHKETCPHCAKPLAGEAKLVVSCPDCSIPLPYEKGCKELTCPHCNCVFNPETKVIVEKAIQENQAPDIRMTGRLTPEQMIWKHPLEHMPLTTRVIAHPGMHAVGMQGTTQVFQVDGPSVKLSETSLRDDASHYDGGASPMTYVNVYYVRQAINQRIAWGSAVTLTDSYGMTGEFRVTGEIDIDQVTDPAAFLRTFGFDADRVLASRFGMTGEGGLPGDFALKVRERFRSVLPQAMQIVRDTYDYTCENILDHKREILDEMLRQANLVVAEYGVSLSNMQGQFGINSMTESDKLEVRTRGVIEWKLPREVRVHPWDAPDAEVGLIISGTIRMDVLDINRFRRCREANDWRNPNRQDAEVRAEISRFVAERLQGRLLADIQQLIDTVRCPLSGLEGFAGSLLLKAETQLNQEDGFFGSRGLRVRDTTLSIELGSKSAAYLDRERLADSFRQADTDKKLDDIATDKYGHSRANERARADADTDNAVHEIFRGDRLEEARHEAEMRRAQREDAYAAQQRQSGYEAWKDKQRMLREQEEADYERARRAQMARQEEALSESQHEERMYTIAQRIESSKLSWREKLDAYARLQRGLAFRDQLDEREATAEAQIRQERMRNELNAEDRRMMMELEHQEEMLADELEQQRFAREMELRRQRAAEEAAQLKAQFDRDRAAAEAEEKRAQAREEIETLRLMLEYLVRSGDQQVTAEALREAQAQARADWEREHQAEERKAAEQRHQKQLQDERAMHERAMKLVQEMTALREDAKGKNGQAVVDVASLQDVIAQLNGICASINAGNATAAQYAQQAAQNQMNEWFNGVMASAPRAAANPGYHPGPAANPAYAPKAPAAPAYTPRPATGMPGSIVICGNCHCPFDPNLFRCPHCGWQP